jgi:hypothetical protein
MQIFKFISANCSSFARRCFRFLILLAASLVVEGNLQAAPVSFWFNGVIDSLEISGEGLPSGITNGSAFSGYVYYNSTGYDDANTNSFPGGAIGDYYFGTTATFNAVLQVAGHTFAISNSVFGSTGYIGVENNFTAHDYFNLTTGNATMMADGVRFPLTNSALALKFSDASMTAFSSVAIPTNTPSFATFQTRTAGIGADYNEGNGALFWVSGPITNITSTEQVQLNLRNVSNTQIQLAWPIVANGFKLQSRTNLANDVWQDVATPVADSSVEHTVTLPSSKSRQFFRLKK